MSYRALQCLGASPKQAKLVFRKPTKGEDELNPYESYPGLLPEIVSRSNGVGSAGRLGATPPLGIWRDGYDGPEQTLLGRSVCSIDILEHFSVMPLVVEFE